VPAALDDVLEAADRHDGGASIDVIRT